MPNLACDRVEGIVGVVRPALIAHPQMRLVADPFAQRSQNALLANDGFTGQHDHLALAFVGHRSNSKATSYAPDEGCHAGPR